MWVASVAFYTIQYMYPTSTATWVTSSSTISFTANTGYQMAPITLQAGQPLVSFQILASNAFGVSAFGPTYTLTMPAPGPPSYANVCLPSI
jgi:hypothetical protein